MDKLTTWDVFLLIVAFGLALWIVRSGVLWAMQLIRDAYEVLTGKRRWDEDDEKITEEMVERAAEVIASSPLIDAPKLPATCWMGLARAVLKAALEK